MSKPRNITGKGGFGDHPENANHSGRPIGSGKGSTFKSVLRELIDAHKIRIEYDVSTGEGKDKKQFHKVHEIETPDGESIRRALSGVILTKAMTGDIRFIEILMNRAEGKPEETHRHGGIPDSPEEYDAKIKSELDAVFGKNGTKKNKR